MGYLCRDRPQTKKPAALDLHHLDDHQNCKSSNVNYAQGTAQITDGQACANFIGDSARPNQTMKPLTLLAYAGSDAYNGLPTKGRPRANTGEPNHRQAIPNSTLFGLYVTRHIWMDYPCRDSHTQVTAQNQWRSLTPWAYTGPADTVDYPCRDGHAQVTAQNQQRVLTLLAYTGPADTADYPRMDGHTQVTAQNQWRVLTLWAYMGPADTADYPRRDGHAQVTAQNQWQIGRAHV